MSSQDPVWILSVSRADTGEKIRLETKGRRSVEDLKNLLQSETSIEASQQILLFNGKSLSYTSLLCDCGFTTTCENQLFLFPKSFLEPPTAPPRNYELCLTLSQKPTEPVEGKKGSFEYYRSRLAYQYKYAKILYENTVAVHQKSQNIVEEQFVQWKCYEVAKGSLTEYYRLVNQAVNSVMTEIQEQLVSHETLLTTFEGNMDRLKAIELSSSIQAPGKQRLIDCVPQEKLRQWADNCRMLHGGFLRQRGKLQLELRSLNEGIETELRVLSPVDFANLMDYIQSASRIVKDSERKLSTFRQDSATSTENEFDYYLSTMEIEPIYEKQSLVLNSMANNFDEMKKVAAKCVECKNLVLVFVREHLQLVGAYQTKLRDVKANKLSLFQEAFGKIKQSFSELVLVKKLPTIYNLTIFETVRRREYNRDLFFMCSHIAEYLIRMRDEELHLREK